MPQFSYTATNKQGKKISGVQDAENRDQVANILHEQSLVIISIDEKIDVGLNQLLQMQIGGLPLSEKVIFVKQLSTMLTAGLPLLQALGTLVQQTENKGMRGRLLEVYKSVEAGSSLTDSFGKEGTIFSELHLSLIAAGEKSGTLNQIMNRIAIELEKAKNLRSKIIGALIYPVIIFLVMGIVFILLIVFMVPSVKDLYTDFGVDELPAITQFLVSLSEAITQPVGIIALLITVVSVVLGLRYYYSTPSGRKSIDGFYLKMPIFGDLNTKIQLAQFNRLLALLLESGVPIVESLKTIARSMGNKVFEDTINDAATEVLKGSALSVPLAKSKVFPLIMIKMISTGEETGKLDKISSDMSDYYETEVNDITANLTKLMEPLILLLVGVMVGFIAVAIYLPLYSLGQFVQ